MENTKSNKIYKIIITVLVGLNIIVTGILTGFQIKSCVENSTEKTKYTLYVGTNDKDTYKNEIPVDTCVTKVTEICTKYTDGCTIYKAAGYWKDEKSAITKEETIVCILEDVKKETVYTICDEIIVVLNQNSILIETDNVVSTFYKSTK